MAFCATQQIIAHRGLQRLYPENSMLAIQAAIDAGVVAIELDIQFSRDGQAMLFHDAQLNRLTGYKGQIWDYDADYLQQLSVNEENRLGLLHPSRMASLELLLPIIKANPQAHFYFELKSEYIMHHGLDYCMAVLSKLLDNVMRQCSFISFDLQAVSLAKKHYGFMSSALVFRDWDARNELIKQSDADVAFINITRIPDADRIEACRPIAVYEISTIKMAEMALQRGASLLESFKSDTLLKALT